MNRIQKKLNQLNELIFEQPITINLAKILTDTGAYKELKHIPYYNYFLSLIYRDQKYTGKHVRLSSDEIGKIIKDNDIYEKMKANLVKHKIIEIDHSYQVNGYCKGYKINDPYMLNIDHNIDLKTSPSPSSFMLTGFLNNSHESQYSQWSPNDKIFLENIIEKYQKIRFDIQKNSFNRFEELLRDPKNPQYNYIQRNIMNTTVDNDVYPFIQKMLDDKEKLKPDQVGYIKDNKKITYWKNDRLMNDVIAESWIESVHMVNCGIGKISCPPNTHRLYSTITSYPSLLRGFLRYKNKKLYYIDVKNSQPFLFLHFIKQQITGEIPSDVVKYSELVSNGQLYEYLMLAMNRIDILDKDLTSMKPKEKWEYECKRSKFKIDFFAKVFFSTENKNYTERKIFAKLFPTISAIITKMKGSNHSGLSLQLQRFEASLILDRVFYMLAMFHPNSYAVPIHDGIICEESIKDVVYVLMMDELEHVIGVRPSLKVEELF